MSTPNVTPRPGPPSPVPPETHPLLFADLGPRRVVADFSGGYLSSDGGALLLRQIDRSLGVSRTVAACFVDYRHQVFVNHALEELIAQRLYGLALGYEDVNDHDFLRCDPLLAVAAGKTDPLAQQRSPDQQGKALASPSTLNRLELGNDKQSRCHKIGHRPEALADGLLQLAVRSLPKHAREIVLDLDAMGHRLHGLQEGRFFNAYYDDYCYLPLYVVCGDVLLWAQLRTADHGAAEGVVSALQKMVPAVRRRCKRARIIIRGDSGFENEELMAWCEGQPQVYYCLGLSQNARLLEWLEVTLAEARAVQCLCGGSVRRFTEFEYQTRKSWSRARRVIGKAEVSSQGDNPRFVVTNLPIRGFKDQRDRQRFQPQRLYEELYCGRGEMENILKQQTLDLRADRMSTHYLASNQLRLWLASFAYLLVERLRARTLGGTALAAATVGTIREKLFKVAAAVRVSVRRVYVQLSSAYPLRELFALCQRRLMALAPDG
jgi:hypothetical protein